MVKKCKCGDSKAKCCDSKKSKNIETIVGGGLYQNIEKELTILKDQHIRLLADFNNYKSWVEKNKVEWMMSSSKQIILHILPIVDELDGIVKIFKDDTSNICKSVTMVLNHFYKVLGQYGVKKIDVKIGDVFNEEYHEVIDSNNVENKEDDNKIIEIVKDGYTLHDKIIRYTQVIVNYCKN